MADDNDDRSTNPSGLLKCLCMVADEAAALRLPLTLAALQEAIEACALEGRIERPPEPDRHPPVLH